MKTTFKMFIAIAAMIGFTFAGCQAPMGPQGEQGPPAGTPGYDGPTRPAPDLEVSIGGAELTRYTLSLGDSRTLVPRVTEGALVQTVLWELYDDAAGDIINLTREPSSRFPMLTGGNVVVTGIADGEARIRVTALGSGDTPTWKTVTITVEGIVTRLNALADCDNLGDEPAVFYLYGSEHIGPRELSFDGTPVDIVLRSNMPDVVLYLDGPGSMFTVGGGVTLTLEGFTLHGMPSGSGNNNALVRVENGATLIMGEGSRIVGNINPTPAANLANQGGGVHVAVGGTFDMYYGEISGHLAVGHGAGVFNRGSFNMRGGDIFDNATASMLATNTGGGVHNSFGVFNMHGGRIFDNSALAFHPQNAVGGGVANSGTFTMWGGYIFENEAGQGGGVVNAANFIMHGGVIFDNIAVSHNAETPHNAVGGGVLNMSESVFSMHNGAISGNEASGNGGGVLNESGAVFNMHGGGISGNTASNGAGVENLGAFTMHGGAVYGIDYDNGNVANSSFATLRTTGAAAMSRYGVSGVLPNTDLTLRVIFEGGVSTMVIPELEDMAGYLAMQLAWLRTFSGRDGSSNSYNIVVSGDQTIAPTATDIGSGQALPVGRELIVTIVGTAPSAIGISGSGNVFRVPDGVTLILDSNITLRGRSDNVNHLVRVNNGGTLIMNAGSRVTGNFNNSLNEINGGGGVFVNNGGTFILNGGVIAGNRATNASMYGGHGGGVRVHFGGTFVMLGGEIYGNHAARNGGGVFVAGGANPGLFRINGGTIYGGGSAVDSERRNTSGGFGASLNSGAGTAWYGIFDSLDDFDGTTVDSLGVFDEGGTFRITNTTITVEGGVFQGMVVRPDGTLLEQLDWLLEVAADGGEYHLYLYDNEYLPHVPFPQSRLPSGRSNVTIFINNPDTVMRHIMLPAGAIPNNEGTLFTVPSGVTLILGSNVELRGRPWNRNALVRVGSGAAFVMTEGSRIRDNTVTSTQAQNAAGAGVWVNGGGTFVMTGGEITNNATSGSGTSLNGAGVRVESGGAFYMLGGTISNNRITAAGSTSNGGGVWVAAGGTFRMSTGTVHGVDAAPGFENAASNNGAALYVVGGGVAQYGTLSPFYLVDPLNSLGNFVRGGDLRTSSLDVHVAGHGVFQTPVRGGNIATQLTWLREFALDIAEHTDPDYRYVITLSGNETLAPTSADAGPNQLLPTGRNVTVVIEGGVPSSVNLSANGNLFRVPSGVTLVLGNNVTLTGRAGNNSHLVRINDGGTLRMNDGSRITGNTNSGWSANGGGGVNVASGGTLILDGGTITGNATTSTTDLGNGGGVRVESGGTFDMLGGAIYDNESQFGGGVFVVNGGIFRMTDGTVYGNNDANANRARGGLGASLKNQGTAQSGTWFLADLFTWHYDLGTNNATITVSNGIFTNMPGEPPVTATLAERLDWLRAFGQTADVTLSIENDETLSPAQAVLPAGRTITVTGGGSIGLSEVDGSRFDDGSLFAVLYGTTLILDNITLTGRNSTTHAANNHGPLVRVNGGTLRMNAGSKITGNTNSLVPGLPAWWAGGGAVHITNDGTFYMYGGEISGNVTTGAQFGGAGVHITSGTFTMHGGEISDNEGGTAGPNTTGFGAGGVRVAGTFIDGTVHTGTFNMYGGIISGNSTIATAPQNGAGVLVAAMGTFNMRGGEISGNVAHGNNSAGGVFVAFDSNSPRRVAGVFNMHGGTISGNSATALATQTAGGVRVNASSDGTTPIFNMRGGTISGNRAYSTATNASGGVNVLGGGIFRISDGIIHGSGEGAFANYATTGPHALFRTTAATGAQFGTFNGAGVFARVGDLLNEERTIEVENGALIRP